MIECSWLLLLVSMAYVHISSFSCHLNLRYQMYNSLVCMAHSMARYLVAVGEPPPPCQLTDHVLKSPNSTPIAILDLLKSHR